MTDPAALTATLTIRITFRDLLSVVLALIFVIVLGLVSGRLVGIRVGRSRSILTALVGTIIGLAGADAVVHGRTSDLDVAYALTAVFGVLATMLLLIIPEAITRGHVPGRGGGRTGCGCTRSAGCVARWRRPRGRWRCSGRPDVAVWPDPSSFPPPV